MGLQHNPPILDTAVTVTPLLGLPGAIVGMVESFNVLGTSRTANPNGVARALVPATLH
ncbi:MotA/TolQ/ExbB proton channel family protein [Paraburkholderia humisilvae]|uniref:MotA/TolQ/ExbB proton channel family protein n=1 Tax=Paraburkholderia humisilvae TaxID=627669 RepID=UPI001FE86ACE|nr:MotA/TolQ/ExbB proton channel family protein [Paraburkholderia humisilvae]